MMAHNRFARGSGCFTCRGCGKKSRDTDGGNGGVELCPLCYHKAECENTLQDTAGFKGDAYAVFENCKTVDECDRALANEVFQLRAYSLAEITPVQLALLAEHGKTPEIQKLALDEIARRQKAGA